MISKVGTVSVFVQDQKRAKAFYTDILRMELRTDAELFPGSNARWIAVAPSGAETEIILYLPDEGWSQYAGVVGKPQNVTLAVTDLDAVFGDLHAKGVEFTQEPETMPWGTYAMMVDSEGNQLLLVQSPDED